MDIETQHYKHVHYNPDVIFFFSVNLLFNQACADMQEKKNEFLINFPRK